MFINYTLIKNKCVKNVFLTHHLVIAIKDLDQILTAKRSTDISQIRFLQGYLDCSWLNQIYFDVRSDVNPSVKSFLRAKPKKYSIESSCQ